MSSRAELQVRRQVLSAGALGGSPTLEGPQIKMREDRAAGKLVSCTWSALWCDGLICILKLKKFLSHYTKH